MADQAPIIGKAAGTPSCRRRASSSKAISTGPISKPGARGSSRKSRARSAPSFSSAHSLGVLAIAHAAPLLRDLQVKGAFLVAPPAPESITAIPSIDPAFATPPLEPLPFPSLVIASRDDPYAPYADSERLAGTLGAELTDAGNSGHINADSGHGPWPEGLMRFAGFLKTL